MARNIVPRTNKDADLGTPEKNWNKLYTDAVVLRGNDLKTLIDGKVNLNTLTEKGDLFVATGSGVVRFPKGEDGYLLTTNSAKPEGLEWRIGDIKTPLTENLEVTVGSGGDFDTINQALSSITALYTPRYLSSGTVPRVTIRLLSGFVMEEQVLIESIDLSWITIVGDDNETLINYNALNQVFATQYPAFGANNGGFLPIIGQLFYINAPAGSHGQNDGKHGIYLNSNSNAIVLPNCGINNSSDRGIWARASSQANIYGATFSGSYFNIIASENSIINAYNASAINALFCNITAINNSFINADNVTATNAGNRCIYATKGSIISAYNANASASNGTYGFFIYDCGIINMTNAIGNANVAPNTLTQAGILFKTIQ